MGKLDIIASEPDYRWDLSVRDGMGLMQQHSDPDYHWEKHFQSNQPQGAPSPRHPSNDLAPRIPLRVDTKRRSAFLSLFDDDNKQGFEDDSGYSTNSTRSDYDDDDDGFDAIDGYNWATKEKIVLRDPSEKTQGPHVRRRSARHKPSRHVHFSTEPPQCHELPPVNPYDKSSLYWSSLELRSFREDRAREVFELEQKKRDATYGIASAGMSSFFSSSPNAQTKASRREREAKKEAELQAALDDIQEMLLKSDWLESGYY